MRRWTGSWPVRGRSSSRSVPSVPRRKSWWTSSPRSRRPGSGFCWRTAETLRLAELAVRVAGYLEGVVGESIQARAWAELGNARRIVEDLAGAQDALAEADRLARKSGDAPLLRAEILLLRASFDDDLRQFDQAIQRLRRAVRLFLRHGDEIGAARALLKLGVVHGRQSKPREGIGKITQALEILLETDESVLKSMAIHNLIHLVAEAGEPVEAARLIQMTRSLFETGYPRLTHLRFEWLRSRIENDLGKTSVAAEKLERLRQTYLEEKLPYEVALISLDLAAIYAQQGKRQRLRELAEQSAGIFRSLGVARPEVGQVLATLATLTKPWDPPALLAFLRSPAGGVPDTELAEYAGAGGEWDWRRDEAPAGCRRIARCFETLRALESDTRDLPADGVIRAAIERSRLVPLGAAAFEGAQRVANLRKLASAAGELASDGRLSLEEIVEALREGRLADIEMDSPLADDAAEAVRITSIHRMKGLENDWIFLSF